MDRVVITVTKHDRSGWFAWDASQTLSLRERNAQQAEGHRDTFLQALEDAVRCARKMHSRAYGKP